jgi:excisionase family DNA binding protein
MIDREQTALPPYPAYLSIAEVAQLVAVSRWTIQREIDEGRLYAVRVRDTVRIPAGAVEQWLTSLPAVARKPAAAEMRQSRTLGRPRKPGLKGP